MPAHRGRRHGPSRLLTHRQHQLARGAESGLRGAARDYVARRALLALSEGPVSAGSLANLCSCSKRDAREVLESLWSRGLAAGSAHNFTITNDGAQVARRLEEGAR